MTEDVAAVAGRLTEAQREAILQADDGYLRLKHMLGTIVPGLVEARLMMPRVRGMEQDNRLTPLGLAVRQHLQSSHPEKNHEP